MTARFTPITCEEFAERLADFLERDLDEASRAAVEAHVLDCETCRALLSDLRRLSIDASNLPQLAPSRDLWEGIAARIDAPVIPIGAKTEQRDRFARRMPDERRMFRIMSVAAALLFAAVLGGVVTYGVFGRGTREQVIANASPTRATSDATSGAREPQPRMVASTTPAASGTPAPDTTNAIKPAPTSSASVVAPASLVGKDGKTAEQTFDVEIARLRQIVQRRSSQLDPVTISVIERNLKVIDDAIAQCRSALAKDPASRFLIESLNHALETKVELLRTAAMLPART